MDDSYDTAIEILQLLRDGPLPVDRLQAALSAAILGYGDLSDGSDPRQVAGDVLLVVRAALVDDAVTTGITRLRRVG